ncbi:hypothetical protein [Bradyrhizobium sp. NAS96.2]|nr:hypothetical protein [Bradyrhizobium sp. NAS96.2]
MATDTETSLIAELRDVKMLLVLQALYRAASKSTSPLRLASVMPH